MELQRNESSSSGLLRCNPDVHVFVRANRFDRLPLSRAPVITIERAINGGAHRILKRVEHRLPGAKRQPDDRIELGVVIGFDHHLSGSAYRVPSPSPPNASHAA